MIRTSSSFTLTALAAITSAMFACGGGDGGSAASKLATISGTVADGPLAGVVVCYDLNNNAACDTGEPSSAPTDADGKFSIEIDETAAGKHAAVAVVAATAIDKDTGAAVGVASTLLAPPSGAGGSHSVFISPLTTLVHTAIASRGISLPEAAAFVQSQANLAISPLADFTASASSDAQQAAAVARLAMKTLLAQTAAVDGVVARPDSSGSTMSSDDLLRASRQAVLDAVPMIAAAAAQATVADAHTPAARESAMDDAALQIATKLSRLTTESAPTLIGLAKLPVDAASATIEAGAILSSFRHADADNWYLRAFLWSVADDTPDAGGWLRNYEHRSQRSAGQTVDWGYGSSPERQGDLHWNGSSWVSCPAKNRSTPSDAMGWSEYDYCDKYETGVRTRIAVDIGGRSLRSVAELIRGLPDGFGGADWGPSNLDLLGNASLPPGAKLYYQTNTPLATGVAYDVRSSGVNRYSDAVAEGGDARGGANPACATASSPRPVTSLEDMVAGNPGLPCIFQPGGNATGTTGERNESWGASTSGFGQVSGALTPPAGTGGYYTTVARLRVGFIPGSTSVNYFSCMQRAVDGSTRNCERIGGGSYRIETLGDARVMFFTGQPLLALRAGYSTLYIERGGKVYSGWQNPVGSRTASVRLNLPAANAFFAQLGMPLLAP